ncbi:MAG: Hsp20/alpha crystallin family protein [Clostridia bacterium]|nr:Hsp20/alpha crystallin family protein [Clostridia bacterium]
MSTENNMDPNTSTTPNNTEAPVTPQDTAPKATAPKSTPAKINAKRTKKNVTISSDRRRKSGKAVKQTKRTAIIILVITLIIISATATVLVVTLGNKTVPTSHVKVEITPTLISGGTSTPLAETDVFEFDNETGTTSKVGKSIEVNLVGEQYVVYQYRIYNQSDNYVTFEIDIPDVNSDNFKITYLDNTLGAAEQQYQNQVSGSLKGQEVRDISLMFKVDNVQSDATIMGTLTLTIIMV